MATETTPAPPTPCGVYVCTACGCAAPREREVVCWNCGRGEMVFRRFGEPAPAERARYAITDAGRAALADPEEAR